MWRVGLLLATLAGSLGAIQTGRSMQELEFLTRDGCVNTPDMTVNLDDALIVGAARKLDQSAARKVDHLKDVHSMHLRSDLSALGLWA
jgi:hypothetical protein